MLLSHMGTPLRSVIEGRDCLVGRHPDCHVRLTMPDISRRHCRIAYFHGEFFVTDYSTNGTYVNGELLHNGSRTIKVGDTIQVGQVLLDCEPLNDMAEAA